MSLNGIRSEKMPHMSRRAIIPQLIRSKECNKFIYPFIGNIRENDHVKYRKGDKNSEKTETE